MIQFCWGEPQWRLNSCENRKKLTQAECAEYLKIPLRTYQSYENAPEKQNSIKYASVPIICWKHISPHEVRYHIEDISPVPIGTDIIEKKDVPSRNAFFFMVAGEGLQNFDLRVTSRKAAPCFARYFKNWNKLASYNRKKLVVQHFRRECVYKRTENASVTFCGKESQTKIILWMIFGVATNEDRRQRSDKPKI